MYEMSGSEVKEYKFENMQKKGNHAQNASDIPLIRLVFPHAIHPHTHADSNVMPHAMPPLKQNNTLQFKLHAYMLFSLMLMTKNAPIMLFYMHTFLRLHVIFIRYLVRQVNKDKLIPNVRLCKCFHAEAND